MRLFALLLVVASLAALTLTASVPPRGGDDLQLQIQRKRFVFGILDNLGKQLHGADLKKIVGDKVKALGKAGQKKLHDLTSYIKKIQNALTGDFGKRSDLSATLPLLGSDFDAFKGNLDSIVHYLTQASGKSENKRQFGSGFDAFKGNLDSIAHYLTQGTKEGPKQKRFIDSIIKALNNGDLKTKVQGLTKAGVKKLKGLFGYLNKIKDAVTGDFGKREMGDKAKDVLDLFKDEVDDIVHEVLGYLRKHIHP